VVVQVHLHQTVLLHHWVLQSCQEPSPGFCINGDWSVDQCGCHICYPGTCLDQDGVCCECTKLAPKPSVNTNICVEPSAGFF
jgi:hypothetical protein